MNITIERNSRGNLEINQRVLNSLAKEVVLQNLDFNFKDLVVESEITAENNFYLSIKIILDHPSEPFETNEKKLMKLVNTVFLQSLNLRPRNITIIYLK